jgi:hypothetical protein
MPTEFSENQSDQQMRQFVFERFEITPGAVKKAFRRQPGRERKSRRRSESQPARIAERDFRNYPQRFRAETVE